MNNHACDSAIAHQKIRSAADDEKRKILSSTKTNQFGKGFLRTRLDPKLGRPPDAQGGVFRHRLMQTHFAFFAHDRLQFFRHHQFGRQQRQLLVNVSRAEAKDEIVRKLEESQHKRKTTQPAASSAGCIFKNPESIPAGKLVDELGLKNCTIGKARVSEVHGNFIVNDGGATAAEMLELIAKIQVTAREERGVELQTEVQIVGEES